MHWIIESKKGGEVCIAAGSSKKISSVPKCFIQVYLMGKAYSKITRLDVYPKRGFEYFKIVFFFFYVHGKFDAVTCRETSRLQDEKNDDTKVKKKFNTLFTTHRYARGREICIRSGHGGGMHHYIYRDKFPYMRGCLSKGLLSYLVPIYAYPPRRQQCTVHLRICFVYINYSLHPCYTV